MNDKTVLIVLPHAHTHALETEEIEYAWLHANVRIEREYEENVLIRIGPANKFAVHDGTFRDFAGLIARQDGEKIFIFHAKRPPVPSLIKEVKKAL
ncbi:MAG: hypothetical protein IKZ87_08110, partial [Actinomycetaceae bacterium]|nr:hypothetical protein [Actinomycetaceae bacterium]